MLSPIQRFWSLTMFHAYNSNHLITFLFFFTVSIAAFGMLLGSLMAGPFANLIGRQWASIIGTCGCLVIGYSLFGQFNEV